MRIGELEVCVDRKQRIGRTWKEWSDCYPGEEDLADPLSAVDWIRRLEGSGPWELRVFSGKSIDNLKVLPAGRRETYSEVLGDVSLIGFSLSTDYKASVGPRGQSFVWISDDDCRIPVFIEVRSSLGVIRGKLVDYEPHGENDCLMNF